MKPNYLISACMLIIFLGYSPCFGGVKKYPVADIPKSLLKDAKAVVRNEDIVVEVKSNGKLVQKIRYAITILNKNGNPNADFMVPYDKNVKVSNIRTQLFDEFGIEYKKKGGFEVLDYAMISNGSIYDDNRVKFIDPEHYEYPFTIEYTYEITWTGVMNYPNWYPLDDYNIAVEKSKFTLIIAKDASCRHYEQNITNKALVVNSPENTTYTWELTNTAALTRENYSPSLYNFAPVVYIAPSKVDVEGYEGNFETWSGFGFWINQLNQGRNNLSDETRARIKKIASGYPDDRSKIKALYEYMQNKTRYVSIQVGIGGFQPFDAETVDRLSYGDCKALSNYMKSILEVAGISSLYTLVAAGREKPIIREEFPSSQFNHAILCVPLAGDTIWLECTDQSGPFNYTGTFTADRDVLLITEKGGKFVHTPKLTARMNLLSRKVNVDLNQDGSGYANVKSQLNGERYDSYLSIIRSDQVDRKKLVTGRIHIPNFELDDFNITETKSESPYITEKLNLTLNNYCTKVGDKLMLCPNLMNKMGESPFQSTTRKTPVSFKWPVYEIDTVTYTLPQGYTIEKIPSKVSIQSDYGKYTTEATKSGSTLQYVRTFEIYKGEYPVDRYEDIVAFFDKIVIADDNKILLTRIK